MKSSHRRSRRRETRPRRTWPIMTAAAVVGCAGAIGAFLFGFQKFMATASPFNPIPLEQQPKEAHATIVYAGDGSVYMRIPPLHGPNQVRYGHIPKVLQNAVVATEDHSFWTRSGLDVRGILRAALHDLRTHSRGQGASTIEEQLAKIVYLNDDKSLQYKVREIAYGLEIDRYLTKQQILTQYLNRVYLGENCVGMAQAAQRYFGVDLAKGHPLTLAQAALLAGLPQAPSSYDPIRHPNAALIRRNQVLQNMGTFGYISSQVARQTEKQPLGTNFHNLTNNAWDKNPLFTNFLMDTYGSLGYSRQSLLQGGLKLYTTISPTVQRAVNDVFWGTKYHAAFPTPIAGKPVDAAAIFVDPKTGSVLGAAGSRKSDYYPDGFDRVYAYSQPGSTIKPVLEYGAAIQSGRYTQNSILNNTPHNFGGGYYPQNDSPAPGRVTMKYALVNSENVASVWLLQKLGIQTGLEFAERDGIQFTNNDKVHLAIAIGGMDKGVTPWQMAQAYEAFDNHGVQNTEHLITRIVNENGHTIYRFKPTSKRVMSPRTASTMTQLMVDVVKDGTGQDAKIPGWDTAGKTGTVQYDRGLSGVHSNWISRAWWDGYTPNMVGSVYIGYDDPHSTRYHLNWKSAPNHYCELIFRDIAEISLRHQKPEHFTFIHPIQQKVVSHVPTHLPTRMKGARPAPPKKPKPPKHPHVPHHGGHGGPPHHGGPPGAHKHHGR